MSAKIDLLELAKNQGLPFWAASELGFNKEEIEYLKNNRNIQKEKKYLSWLFPHLKHKIMYRYDNVCETSERSSFKNRLRTLIRTNMQNNNISARTLSESMIEFLLGYSINDLMHHLETQFTADMDWNNHGSFWQIDHIYPCSKLKYKSCKDSNFIKLWSINNLRPLCKIENNKKSDKIERCGENG